MNGITSNPFNSAQFTQDTDFNMDDLRVELDNIEQNNSRSSEEIPANEEAMVLIEVDEETAIDAEDEVLTAWENLQRNWWKIHNDADESDSREEKENKKRVPIGKKEYCVLVGTILTSLGLQVAFRDEPIFKGTTSVTINAIKLPYSQMQQGTVPKYVMRAVAIATFIAGITLYYVPEDPNGVINILRAAPLTDIFMTVILKCDLANAGLDSLLKKLVDKCTGKDMPKGLATAITKGSLSVIGGTLMNISQLSPFIRSGAAVLAKANMRSVVDELFKVIETMPEGFKKNAAIAAVLGTCTAFAAGSAYALTQEFVTNSSFAWAPAAVLVCTGDTLTRVIKATIKSFEGQNQPEETERPFWKKCVTVGNGVLLIGVTGVIAYVVGPATLATAAGSAVANNSGMLTWVCSEMSSFLKVGSKKLLPDNVALYGTLSMLAVGTGYHLFETISHMTYLLTPVQRATGAAFLTAVLGVAGYQMKDHLRSRKKTKEELALEAAQNPEKAAKKKKKKKKKKSKVKNITQAVAATNTFSPTEV